MKHFKIILFTILISTNIFAQDFEIAKTMVGFTCGYGRSQTKLVKDVTVLIKEKKYNKISSLLRSKNSGEVYLAIITIERLTKLGLYQLNEEDSFIFSKIKQFPYMIYFCDSCMPDFVSMKSLLETEASIGAKAWLDATIIIE